MRGIVSVSWRGIVPSILSKMCIFIRVNREQYVCRRIFNIFLESSMMKFIQYRSVKSGEQTLTPKFLDHAKKELSTRIKQYRDRTHPVPIIQRGVAAPPPPRGRRLVHIGFVQDENTARILSWAAGRKMVRSTRLWLVLTKMGASMV